MQFDMSFFDSNAVLLGELNRLSGKSAADYLMANPILGYPVLVVAMSVIAFLLYGWDKHQAKHNGWRVPERRLHGVAFLGGWPGAMFGQQFFRHKTQKSDFKIMTWLAAGLHMALIAWYFYRWLAS